ncbi:MAG: electron transfer flavoprotein subunit beta/FixA family protein [bacterium]|nr:electron transfer flavoprotein subunit beta/FixA family protein [bacterium]
MHIIVLIKQVPELKNVKLDKETGTVIREGVESVVNPLDLYAVEVALSLKEKFDSRITALSMGPLKADKAIREVISMGVDNGVLLSDKKFAGSDTWATSYIIGKAIEKLGNFDLILAGERAIDGDTSQVGPEVAAYLDIPTATYVNKIETFSLQDKQCKITRATESGIEMLKISLPVLFTVVKEISIPRLPTYKGKKYAKQIDIPIWGINDLDLNENFIGLKGSPTRVFKTYKSVVSRKCKKISANNEMNLEKAGEELVKFLKSTNAI